MCHTRNVYSIKKVCKIWSFEFENILFYKTFREVVRLMFN